MANAKHILDALSIEVDAVPISTINAAVVGDWHDMTGRSSISFLIIQGAWAGGTPAVTLDEAKTVAGGSTKNLAFSEYWSMTGTAWARSAVTNPGETTATFNLTNAPNILTLIHVPASLLDQANGFDCIQVNIADPGANADLICVLALSSGSNRYASGLGLPNNKVDLNA